MSTEETKPEETKKPAKMLELEVNNQIPWLTDRLIYITKHGSHAYGTSVPESDNDYKGIVIPPLPYFFGFSEHFEQAVSKDPDLVFYDIRKFFKLAANANPTLLEMLFTVPEDRLLVHPLAQKLIDHRDLFVTQLVAKTFVGYAASQLKALRKSVINPPKRENPKRAKLVEDFGFDTKDAMHIVRLLRMGIEILEGKGVLVRRPDAEDLLNIRAGSMSAEEIFEYAVEAEAKIQDLLKKTKLPQKPDMVKIDALCIALVQASFDHEIKIPVMATGFQSQVWTFSVGDLNARKLLVPQEA